MAAALATLDGDRLLYGRLLNAFLEQLERAPDELDRLQVTLEEAQVDLWRHIAELARRQGQTLDAMADRLGIPPALVR